MAGNSKLYTGSICLSDLIELAKQTPVLSSFERSEKNKKAYVGIQIWVNEEPDEYGKHVSIKLNPKKDSGEPSNNYIGQAQLRTTTPAAINAADQSAIPDEDDLPF